MTLEIQGQRLFENGRPLPFDRAAVRSHLKSDTIRILIDLDSGVATATAWGCDLSKKYVEINAEYTT
jgi:glutamate N-acetyltransferase/amino-acid N-acetyltransferase